MSMFLTVTTNHILFQYAHKEAAPEQYCRIQTKMDQPVHCDHVAAYLAAAGNSGTVLGRLIAYKASVRDARDQAGRTAGILNDRGYMCRTSAFCTTTPDAERLRTGYKLANPWWCSQAGDQAPLAVQIAHNAWETRAMRANFCEQLNELGRPYALVITQTDTVTVLSFFKALEMALLKHFVKREAPEHLDNIAKMADTFLAISVRDTLIANASGPPSELLNPLFWHRIGCRTYDHEAEASDNYAALIPDTLNGASTAYSYLNPYEPAVFPEGTSPEAEATPRQINAAWVRTQREREAIVKKINDETLRYEANYYTTHPSRH